jgi:hypothetical protein
MEIVKIKKLQFDALLPDLEIVSATLDKISPGNRVDKINWPQYDYRPDVKFSTGYTENELLLKYYITEDYFKAEMTETNQPVYEDSCVEFFVSPANDGIYYNFEFNGIGTCLMGAGTGRNDRKKISPDVIALIRRKTSPGKAPVNERKGRYSWAITIAIPYRVFMHHNIGDPEGQTFMANFYKCGDKMTVPHYLTWNPIKTAKPDFHRPEYFGLLKFE